MSIKYSYDAASNKPLPVSLNLEQANSLIIERARQLVHQLIENRGHDNPPFLPEEYAPLQGIKKIVKEDLGNVSGLLLRFHDGPVIKVNKNHNSARQNFSCAHELAHHLIRELKLELNTENISYRTFNPQACALARAKDKERLCDAAATELLMPEFVFRKHLSGFGVSIQSIERLANIFKASVQATARRIAEVSPEPCIMLLWKPQLRTKGLRLAWCIGPGIKSRSKAYYIPMHTNVRYPSVLYKAYEQDKHVKCHKKFKRGTDIKRLPMESKGFGRGETRYVISLAFTDR